MIAAPSALACCSLHADKISTKIHCYVRLLTEITIIQTVGYQALFNQILLSRDHTSLSGLYRNKVPQVNLEECSLVHFKQICYAFKCSL